MIVKIDRDSCVNCGACAAISPEVFDIGDSIAILIRTDDIPVTLQHSVFEAINSCPTAAISLE